MRGTEKKRSNRKKMILTILTVLLVTIGAAIAVYFYKATNYDYVVFDLTDEELGIETMSETTPPSSESAPPTEQEIAVEESVKWDDKIVNIALFGLDRRSPTEKSRSDSMMILTIDFKHHKVKLSSLMRDMEVAIDGHGRSKLNHAYAYGGAELAVKTINQNFGTDIRDYVSVDFFTLEKIIDAIGGVPVEVKDAEIDMINRYMDETAKIQNTKPVYLKTGGLQTLNGMQAVSFSRIRYVGNGDFERTERQRKVLSAMIDKAKGQGITEIPSMLMKVSPYVESTLTRSDILSIAYKYFTDGNMTLEQERFPIDGTWKAGKGRGGAWIMDVNAKQLKDQIQGYIFKDEDPTTITQK